MSSIQHIVNVSGGKDSTALYLLAMESGRPFRAIFCDTGHEHPLTIEYVNTLSERTGGPAVETIRADFTKEFARKRAFIAEHWQSDLMRDVPGHWRVRPEYMTETDDGEEIPAGCVPDDEPPVPADPYSPARAPFHLWTPGRNGLTEMEAADVVEQALLALAEPTGIPFLDLCMFKGRFPGSRSRFCTEELKVLPALRQVIFPAAKDGPVLRWVGVRADESISRAKMPKLSRDDHRRVRIWRPLLAWTVDDVFAMHRKHGIEPNPLYKLGMGRVGCMPCIMSRKAEIAEIARRWPEEIARVAKWESLVSTASKFRENSTLFPQKVTRSARASDGRYPDIHDVVEWAKTSRGGKQYDLEAFAEPAACHSLYGLCE